ncbi:MAG: peptidyl-prolyl cis-trans isomerase [Desulfobacteraceae bacterium]|nr:peptidyl-prolyl cis-trans isomerase [Desulfobacteraceae bacterium]
MRKALLALPLIVYFFLTTVSCVQDKEKPAAAEGKVLATVNRTEITESDLNFMLRGGHGLKVTPEMKEESLERLVDLELLYQQGLKLGFDKDMKYRNAVRQMELRTAHFRRGEMARQVYNREIAATVKVHNEEGKKYYDENAAKIRTEVHVAQMVFVNRAEATKALEQLATGVSFEDMSEKKSEKSPAKKKSSWDLGYLKWNQLPSGWQETIYRLKSGEVSGIIDDKKTGIRIIKLIDKREISTRDYESVKAVILNRLRDRKVKEAYEKYIQTLRSNQEVKVY